MTRPKSRKSSSQHPDESILGGKVSLFDEKMGLSDPELQRYKQLSIVTQAKITDLLRERNRLNDFVKDYLQEEIHKQFGAVLQLLFPSEHSLKYALQKVDEIETAINAQLDDDIPLFDEDTTKINRIEMLLTAARTHQQLLEKKITKFEHSIMKIDILHHHKQKYKTLTMIIDELQHQIDSSEFHIHDQAILDIKDSEFNYFLNKLKSIGITGFTPKPSKDQSTLLKVSFFTSIYTKLIPGSPNSNATKKNSEDPDAESKTTHPSKHRKN